MPYSAILLPELRLDLDLLFSEQNRNEPHRVRLLIDECDPDKAPYYSGFIPFDIPEDPEKKKIPRELLALGRHLLSTYEDEGVKKWPHADQRKILEKAIRLFKKVRNIIPEDPADLELGKAYLYRSRIIKPKGLTIPGKKIEALKAALDYLQKADSGEAALFTALTLLEMDRAAMAPENIHVQLKDAVQKADAARKENKWKGKKRSDLYRIQVRLEEMRGGDFKDQRFKEILETPIPDMELEKLKIALYSEKTSGQTLIKQADELLAKLSKLYLSHPLWDDTVRFVRKMHRLTAPETRPGGAPQETISRCKAHWGDIANRLWENADENSRKMSDLHLRWYWSRQRDLYDLAFLAALENKDFHRAARIADSAKNRPALTWQALEQVRDATGDRKLKENMESYAQAFGGGYVAGAAGTALPVDSADIPEKAEKDTAIVQFYIVHLKDFQMGYALICQGEKGWSCCHPFDYEPIWSQYLKWQNLYFDLPSQQRVDSAPEMVDLCKVLGKSLSFLFDIEDIENILIIPHDFLHRVPVHGAFIGSVKDATLLLSKFECHYMPALQYRSDEVQEVSTAPPVLLQHYEESEDENHAEEFDDLLEDFDFDKENSSSSVSPNDLLELLKDDHTYVAIRCHGKADAVNPFFSKLLLNDQLRLLDIAQYDAADLSRTRIFLGACETDLFRPVDQPIDEHLSLASILFNKRSPAIIATMWEVKIYQVYRFLENFDIFGKFSIFQRQELKKGPSDPEKFYNGLCFRRFGYPKTGK